MIDAIEAELRSVEQRIAHRREERRKEWDLVVAWTAEEFEVAPNEIKGRGRPVAVADARQTAIYLIREFYSALDSEIAAFFDRTRSAVGHAYRAVKVKVGVDKRMLERVERLQGKILTIRERVESSQS